MAWSTSSKLCGLWLAPKLNWARLLPLVFHFKARPTLKFFVRMCVTVKRSQTVARQLLAFILPFFPAFPNYFAFPLRNLQSCGTRCLCLEGLKHGSDLIIGSSHQSFQSTSSISIKLKGRAHSPRLPAFRFGHPKNNKRNASNIFVGNF